MGAVLKSKAKIVRDNSVEFDRIVRAVTEDKAGAVYIGVLQEDSQGSNGGIGLAGIATVHEFGAFIQGTAFGDIVIPERSFIRSTMDAERERIAQLSERLWKLVIDLKITKFEALQRMGVFIQGAIQKKITELRRTGGTSARGYATNTDVTSTIQATIQPLSPREMRNLPRGQSTKFASNVWSETELQERDLVTNPEGTQLTLQGVEFWREGPFYHATGVVEDAAR